MDDGVVSENMAHCEHDAALNASRYNLGAVLLCNLRKHNKTEYLFYINNIIIHKIIIKLNQYTNYGKYHRRLWVIDI